MIEWTKLNIPHGKSGEVQVICPSCSHNRKPQNQKVKCFSSNVDKGLGKCHHCGEISIRDIVEKKEYKKPNQEWQNFTSLPDAVVKYLKDRGISQETAIRAKITFEEYYQPKEQKKVSNIVFNYFEGDSLLNKKYRSARKSFTQTAQTKKIFYGLNDIIGEKDVFIVEGEMDKISLMEVGFDNCISVPNGANDLNDVIENCEKYIKDLEKVYVAVDMDEAGQRLEKEIIKRFGKWRCERVEFKGKDANEDLVSDRLELEKTLRNTKAYPVDGTYTAKDVSDELDDLYDNGLEETLKPKSETFSEFNDIFSILLGQLTTVTGIPSNGKSNWLEDYVINIINDHDLKASFYSPEHLPMQSHHSVLSEKVIGKPFRNDVLGVSRMTKEELNEYKEWSSERVFLTMPDKGQMVDWDWIIEKFKEQVFRYGIDIFVIDAFNKVKRKNGESLSEISEILSRLTLFVQAYNVHIFLVAHPTKMRKKDDGQYEIPTLYDVKGSGDFRDQSHNGIVVHRYFDENNELGEPHTVVGNVKTKFKHQGSMGEFAAFKYEVSNGRYYKFGSGCNMTNLINGSFQEKKDDIPKTDSGSIFESENPPF